MSFIVPFLSHYFSWIKKEFFFYILLNIIFGVFFSIFDIYALIELLTPIVLFVVTFSFSSKASISPTFGESYSCFSWKYIQSLPVDRRYVIIGFTIAKLIALFPLIIWSLIFFDNIKELFDVGKDIEIVDLIRIYMAIVLLFISRGIGLISQVINEPRKQFQNVNSKKKTMVVGSILLSLMTFSIYYFIVGKFLVANHSINIFIVFKWAAEGLQYILSSFWLPVILLAFVIHRFKLTLKQWCNESLSYKNLNFNYRKYLIIISINLLLLCVGGFQIDFYNLKVPTWLMGHKALTAIYYNNTELTEKFIGSKDALKYSNKYGYTMQLAAIERGQINVLKKILQEQGNQYLKTVTRDGVVRTAQELAILSGDPYVIESVLSDIPSNSYLKERGIESLLAAIGRCNEQAITYLVDRVPNFMLSNRLGKHPIEYALEERCDFALYLFKSKGKFNELSSGDKSKLLDQAKDLSINRKYFIRKALRQ